MKELMHLLDLREERALIDHLKWMVPEYQAAKRHEMHTRAASNV